MQRGFCVFIFLLFLTSLVKAQGNDRCKWIKTDGKPVVLDSLTAIPESIRIENQSDIPFEFMLNTNQIKVTSSSIDSVLVCFRTFPYDLHSKRANKTLAIYDSTALFKDAIRYQQTLALPKREEAFSTQNIQKTGSITRGISFGNRQDVFVNSSLNLQMEGQLTETVNLRAVISDRNVPFQPEGNTQQLQDFDNIYIQLYNDNWALTAGDVVLKNGASNFLRYYKNVQGAQFKTNYTLANGFKAETTVAASVAKGRFASINVDPIEGVLGPYRVRGPNNERFIIVIAGSEKVFVDGVELTRGFDNDYIIDYNLGEVTFTNKVLITQFSRIRIDFEFSDQNYARSIFQASHYQTNDKLNFSFNYYGEKDNRNQPLAFDLSLDEKLILADAGDNLNQAVTSRVDSIEYTPDFILYRKTIDQDDLGNDYEIFQYSTNPDSAFFNVQFSEVGQGNGNYRITNSTTNGRIYRWTAPINGQLQGNYEPVSLLNAPNQKQMVTLGAAAKLNKYDQISAEVAFSKNDLNLFSELDADDDRGKAYKLIYEVKDRPVKGLEAYKLNAGASYEYNDDAFSFIDRVRYIEFDRDWSFNPNDFTEKFSENIFNSNVSLQKDGLNNLEYKLVRRKRGEAVDGFQQYFKGVKELGFFRLKVDAFLMNNDQNLVSSSWKRLATDLSIRSKWLIPGYKYQVDRNEVTNNLNSQVVRSAMNFEAHSFYLKNQESLNTTYGIEYQLRKDRTPFNGELIDNNESETWSAFFNTSIDETQNLNVLFTYRNLENLNKTGEDRNDKTVMGRLDWRGDFFERSIQSELSYNLANSRELRREFIFIQVATGEGTHTWRDDNGDGVQDLNEFYIAVNPDEKNYAKIFVPTDTYEEAFNTNISYRLRLKTPSEWFAEGGIKKLLARFTNTSSYSVNSKITDDNLGNRLWPIGVDDDLILSSKEALRSTLFFNQSRAAFAADLGIAQLENKQLLLNGFESINSDEIRAHIRWNLNNRVNWDLTHTSGQKASSSDVLTQRNYLIDIKTYQPSISWQPNNYFRITTSYALKDKQNVFTEASTEKSSINEFSIDSRFSKATKTTLSASFKYINIDFEGEENSPTGYELLEALRPGRNLTWNINWQQKLGNGLQLLLRYDARKSEGNPIVHLGRVQVSALF
uniref:hypothetical protein n=1 Tax=Roseivirga sp. TaxID=1964215 RepID=UPI0040486376